MKLIVKLLPILLSSMVLALVACNSSPRTALTPLEALQLYPGALEGASPTTLQATQVWRQEPIGGGMVRLYSVPDSTPGSYRLVSTYVVPGDKGNWYPTLSVSDTYTDGEEFVAGYAPGRDASGSRTLASAFGLAKAGTQVRIEWEDGVVSFAPVEGGVFCQSRLDVLHVTRIELLDEYGELLAGEDF